MGPYCQFCGHRCFVERFVPGSNATILATCPKGMAHDRERSGYDHTTAVNPNDPAIKAYAAAIRENVAKTAVRDIVTGEAFAEAVLAGAKGCIVPPGMQPGRSISAPADSKAEAAAQLEFVRRTLRYALIRVGVA